MADEYVRTGEFVRRMDERFDHAVDLAEQRVKAMGQRSLDLEKRMDQGFARAEKAREQNLVHLNQRLDGMQAGIRGVRNMMVALYGPIVAAILAAAGKYLFFISRRQRALHAEHGAHALPVPAEHPPLPNV
ncbi:MAG: hypothetical protein OXP66_08345 [Candidatus Tectomicrobia bacterium]|nr:hypothetical protein [Candidatus Tectomicrobia bacterium]